MIKKEILFGAAAILAACSMSAEAKYYKWVDPDGTVHYETTMQPEAAAQKPVEMEQGREVKKKEAPETAKHTKPVAETPEQVEQKRRDQALLGTYTTEAEIDLARDRNLQQVNAHLSGVQMRIKSAQGDLDDYQKERAALTKAGKPVDKVLQEQIEMATAKVAKLEEERAKVEAEGAVIRARFEADKNRFRELKAQQGQ